MAFASSSLLALPILKVLFQLSKVEIVGLISTPDQPKGRSGEPSPNEFALEMSERGLSLVKPRSDEELLESVREMEPDLVVVIAYGRLVKDEALKIPRYGWINVHFSLLPAFRGAAPVQRALIEGSNEFGFTIFRLESGMDTGPYYVREAFEMQPTSCATDVLELLAEAAAGSFDTVIGQILEGRSPRPQSGEASYAPKIQKEELRLDLEEDGQVIWQKIRGLTEKPGPWFPYRGKRIVIHRASPVDELAPPMNFVLNNDRFLLGLKGMTLELLSLTPEGKRRMSGLEFARGLRLSNDQAIGIDE